jgi:trimeric autotransporter adhesin
MSTKTLRKRIALVAVSALGAGLLSVVAVPSASAAVPDTGTLHIATTASTTGSAVANTGDVTGQKSVGFITATSTTGLGASATGYLLTGGAATGLVYAGAKIAFAASSSTTSGDSLGVVVTGGALDSMGTTGGTGHVGTLSLSGDRTVAADVQTLTTMTTIYGAFNVSAAAGTQATITVYKGTGIAGTTTATNGTLVGSWTFTVASGSAAGVVSLADSSVFQQASTSAGIAASGTNQYDTSSRIDNGKVGIIYVALKDAYTSAITTGTLAVTATNSALVNAVDTTAAADSYAASASFDSTSCGADGVCYVYVKQPVANTAGTTTVTITHNGTVLATKTLNWNGDIASLEVVAADSSAQFANGATENSWPGGIAYKVKDAAGNILNVTALPTLASGSTGALVGASIGTTVNTTSGVLQTAALGEGSVSLVIPTSALYGAGTYRLKTTNSSGVAVYSAVQNVTVSNGSTNSFEVKWNASSYKPGDIASFTVTLKDAYGNLMADGTEATGWAHAVGTTTELVAVGTACSATSYTLGGYFTCKYGVGNVAGSYSYSTDLTTLTPQSATVGSIAITGSGVSNADVLKAIVSLIASINKQIAALQKALLKK